MTIGRGAGTMADLDARLLDILRRAAGNEEVARDPDLRLYDTGLLDSLATVTVMAALAEELGLEVSPADFDREAWATPRLFAEDVVRRLAGRRGA